MVKKFEGGKYYECRGVKVLDLRGSWREMGRQYGYLAAADLAGMLDFMRLKGEDPLIGTPESTAVEGSKSAKICATAEKLVSRYPVNMMDILEGMAETSGLSLQQLKVVNAAEYAEADFACTGLAVWGDYSRRGRLIYGRNYDAATYSPIKKHIAVVVFHPTDGSLTAATIGYLGEIFALNAINEKGIFLELNNGMMTTGFNVDYSMNASSTELFQLIFKAQNLDDVDKFFAETPSFAGFIIGVASPIEARAYEWCKTGSRRADGLLCDDMPSAATDRINGVSMLTNHFVNPSWGFPSFSCPDIFTSLPRRRNIAKFLADNKGRISVRKMKKFMPTGINNGGVAFYGPTDAQPSTQYQLLWRPGRNNNTGVLFIQVPGLYPWRRLRISRFLK